MSTNMKTDEELTTGITHRLAGNLKVGSNNINVTVVRGDVTLQGSIATEEGKKNAEEIVRSVPGVKNVLNELVVEQRSFGTTAIAYDQSKSRSQTHQGS